MVYVYSVLKDFFDVTVIDLENEFHRPKTDNELTKFKKKALQKILSVDADYVAISCCQASIIYPRNILQRKSRWKGQPQE